MLFKFINLVQLYSLLCGTRCQGITQYYLHNFAFIHERNETYLLLPSQPKLVLIYRPRRNGKLIWRSSDNIGSVFWKPFVLTSNFALLQMKGVLTATPDPIKPPFKATKPERPTSVYSTKWNWNCKITEVKLKLKLKLNKRKLKL